MIRRITTLQGFLALSPLLVFLALYVALGCFGEGFRSVPITVVFLVATLYSLLVMKGNPAKERMNVLFSGAHQDGLLQMVWIFILAGAFSSVAKQMGAIDAMVSLVVTALPSHLILAGLFFASCLVSLSIGTSVGTIAALTPIASGMASETEASIPMVVGVVVGGAFFGDNLSFISDTTIVATRTQGCRMRDKFRQNIRIALPAALIAMGLYVALGSGMDASASLEIENPLLILPYAFVLIAAMCGMDVMLVLVAGVVLAAGIGLDSGAMNVNGLCTSINDGIYGMSELIVVTLMAACMMAVIRHAGGIDFILSKVTHRLRSSRAAEFTIAALVVVTNACTANNTIAILTIGPMAHDIATSCGVNPRRAASILDTFSCFAQGILPYGAQLLIASGLVGISPVEIIPYLYYPFILGAVSLLNITLHHEKNV